MSDQSTGKLVAGYEICIQGHLGARWAAFKNTMVLAPAGTIACLLIAYPLAYYLAIKASAKTFSKDGE